MWKCNKCGETVEDAFASCWKCGTPDDGTSCRLPSPPARSPSPLPTRRPEPSPWLSLTGRDRIILGLLVGGLIGFLLRPSGPLVGQLPFRVVITEGAFLEGLDQMALPLARASFNCVLAGGILGALGGYTLTRLGRKQ